MRVEDDGRKVDLVGAISSRGATGSAQEQRRRNEAKSAQKTSARNVGMHAGTVLPLVKLPDRGTNFAGGPNT